MTDSAEDYDKLDCDHVLTGGSGRVLMAKAVTDDFLAIETKKQARLLANAKLWADGHSLSPEQFKGNEGRCGGLNDRMLVAVKTHKIRLYGFIRHFRSMKTLIVVDIDDAKKQNKPKYHILKRAKSSVHLVDDIFDRYSK